MTPPSERGRLVVSKTCLARPELGGGFAVCFGERARSWSMRLVTMESFPCRHRCGRKENWSGAPYGGLASFNIPFARGGAGASSAYKLRTCADVLASVPPRLKNCRMSVPIGRHLNKPASGKNGIGQNATRPPHFGMLEGIVQWRRWRLRTVAYASRIPERPGWIASMPSVS